MEDFLSFCNGKKTHPNFCPSTDGTVRLVSVYATLCLALLIFGCSAIVFKPEILERRRLSYTRSHVIGSNFLLHPTML